MTIPLDNLYDYIFSLTDHNNKNLIMYRFDPHGSKDIKNLIIHNRWQPIQLSLTTVNNPYKEVRYSWHYKQLFCYDQEPLDYNHHKNNIEEKKETFTKKNLLFTVDNPIIEKILSKKNIAGHCMVDNTIYDKRLILHSEKNSADLEKYEKNGFIGVYYWAHAFIALDWYRFAKHDPNLNFSYKSEFINDFNIYSRAWTGSREYRIKFLELLRKQDLDLNSNIFFNTLDNGKHYSEHNLKNKTYDFNTQEIDSLNCITHQNTEPSKSAVYTVKDYCHSAIDVVLETVFDMKKIHLTEKILRPIACGKPFILVSEKDSLKYLKSYGFETFGDLIDESYDEILDPEQRLNAILKTMKDISNISPEKKHKLFLEMHKIAERNKKWVFSENFFDLINNELKENLYNALQTLDQQDYQTGKEPRLIYRACRRYKKYVTGNTRKMLEKYVTEFPERIELSKKI